MNRRFFLKGAGGALLAAPFLTSLRGPASALVPIGPRRSVIFHTPNGCLTNRWFPKVEHGVFAESDLYGTTLDVLAPYAAKLLFPRGLRGVNAYAGVQSLDPKAQSMGSLLTCALLQPDQPRYPGSHSLDHEIARQVNPPGAAPLVFSVGPTSADVRSTLSYSAAHTRFEPIVSSRVAYDALSGVLGSGGAVDYRRRKKQSVLDAVKDDLETYQRLDMGRTDRARVDAWLELVRDTEKGLPHCNENDVGLDASQIASASEGTPADAARAFTVGADTMLQLIALNMLCDTNRSFVMTFSANVTFDWDGIEHTHDHAGLATRNGSGLLGGECLPGVLGMLAQIDGWYAAKFAKLVKLLHDLPEGDAKLLDGTAAMWIHDVSDGNAWNVNNLPIVIAGSAGGYLKQNHVVNLEGGELGAGNSEVGCQPGGDGMVSLDTGSATGNVPINKLYVTLLNALGCKGPDGGPVTSFGTLDGDSEEAGITDPGELGALVV